MGLLYYDKWHLLVNASHLKVVLFYMIIFIANIINYKYENVLNKKSKTLIQGCVTDLSYGAIRSITQQIMSFDTGIDLVMDEYIIRVKVLS